MPGLTTDSTGLVYGTGLCFEDALGGGGLDDLIDIVYRATALLTGTSNLVATATVETP